MNKKVSIFLILSFLLVMTLLGSYTYSMYRSTILGDTNANIASWNITVNGCDIVTPDESNPTCFESTIEGGTVRIIRNFGITDITYSNEGNTNVVDDKLAPGSIGTFKVKIRPNDTQVSFKYKLTASINAVNDYIKLYLVEGSNETLIDVDTVIEKDILYVAGNSDYEDELLFKVVWENDDSGDNDNNDTVIGTNGSRPILEIPVHIDFEQLDTPRI